MSELSGDHPVAGRRMLAVRGELRPSLWRLRALTLRLRGRRLLHVWKHAFFYRADPTEDDDKLMVSDDVAAITNQRLKDLAAAVDRNTQRTDSVSNKLELLVERLADCAKNLHEIVESLPSDE